MNEWLPIKTAPYNTHEMFVIRAFNVTTEYTTNYTSDPVVTWACKGEFPRWKHEFSPIHWTPLPEPPEVN